MLNGFSDFNIVIFFVIVLSYIVVVLTTFPKREKQRYRLLQKCLNCQKFFVITDYFEESNCKNCGFLQRVKRKKS